MVYDILYCFVYVIETIFTLRPLCIFWTIWKARYDIVYRDEVGWVLSEKRGLVYVFFLLCECGLSFCFLEDISCCSIDFFFGCFYLALLHPFHEI